MGEPLEEHYHIREYYRIKKLSRKHNKDSLLAGTFLYLGCFFFIWGHKLMLMSNKPIEGVAARGFSLTSPKGKAHNYVMDTNRNKVEEREKYTAKYKK